MGTTVVLGEMEGWTRESVITVEGIFQQVIWKVLVSSGPRTCPGIRVTCGLGPESPIASSAHALERYGAGAGERTHRPNSTVWIRICRSLSVFAVIPQGWKILQVEKAPVLMALWRWVPVMTIRAMLLKNRTERPWRSMGNKSPTCFLALHMNR